VVSALDFRSGDPGPCHRVVSLDKAFNSTLSLSFPILLGCPCDGLASHPGGSSNALSCYGNGVKLWPCGPAVAVWACCGSQATLPSQVVLHSKNVHCYVFVGSKNKISSS